MNDLQSIAEKVDDLVKFCEDMAITGRDFKVATEGLIKVLPALHERMERIEKWIENERKAIPSP
jgi:hypothetical protein